MDFNKYINENVYGTIPLTETEMDLINARAFQRLRGIKQLGLASLVFPTADHSRFSHSLGVMHIVGKMAEQLHKLEEIEEGEIYKLRIAGLLHDIGHYPFSHLGEKVYQCQLPDEGLKKENEEQYPNYLLKVLKKAKNEKAHHEYLGQYIIENSTEISSILRENNFDPTEISQIITGQHTNILYSQLMHSGLDADRLDYLLRDAAQTGAKYGMIDLDYIIRMLKVGTDDEGNKWVGIDKKGIHSAEHFLMARYFAYCQVTWHKTIKGLEALAAAAFLEMRLKEVIYSSFEHICQLVNSDEWLDFNDSYFIEKLKDFYSDNNSEQNNLIHAFLNRRRPKLIIEKREFREREIKNIEYKALHNLIGNKWDKIVDIASKFDIDENLIFYEELELSIDKLPAQELLDENNEESYKDTIMVIDGDKIYPISKDSSSIIYNSKKLYCLRLYVVDPFIDEKTKLTNEKFSGLKNMVQELFNIEKEPLARKLEEEFSR